MQLQRMTNAVSLMAAATVLVSCQKQEPSTRNEGATASASVSNAAAATKQLAARTRDGAMEAGQKALNEMDAAIDELASKAAHYTGQAKSKADDALAELRAQRDAVGKKFAELKAASQDTWEDVKSGFDQAWQKLKETYDSAKDKFQN